MTKIQKKGESTPLENQIVAALTEVENNSEDAMKKTISSLLIAGAKEVQIDGLKVIIITVPYKQISLYRQAQGFLIPELEKKLDGAQVVIVGKRRAFPKEPTKGRRYKAIRSTGRTLRAVNESLLDDVCFPTSIVGKRIHYDVKGGQVTHVILDQNDRTRVEERLTGFSAAYNRLTGLKTVFEIAV